jgi:putative SOS response-associated peptidase YedK
MCGRFAFFSPADAVNAAFSLSLDYPDDPRFNIAPTQNVMILRLDADGRVVSDKVRWGLVPFWAKDADIGNRMINARAETVAEKPSYRQPFSRRRCLVLADGFYEWRKEASGKTPFYISRADGLPFGMAGLWDECAKVVPADEPPLRTCTIITTPANEFMQDLHHRMPVLMGRDSAPAWLDTAATSDELLQMILTTQVTQMQAWPVARTVNNPINDEPQLIEPAAG